MVQSLYAIIPAAGISERFNQATLKQYAKLKDSTVLDSSIRPFINNPSITKIIVVIHPDDKQFFSSEYANHPKVEQVFGGQQRSDSVYNGLLRLKQMAHPNDWVLVHDAARPCLSAVDLNKLITMVLDSNVGGILAAPSYDTLKKVEGSRVTKTLNRNHIWRALTPQMFRLNLLVEAMEYCKKESIAITDEASAVEQLGLNPFVVPGSASNLKITRPEDIVLAEYYLSHKEVTTA